MKIFLKKLYAGNPRFHAKDAVHLVASLSNNRLSIVGFLVYYKDGKRYDFRFKDIPYFKLKCPINFALVISVVYSCQRGGNDLKDALAEALLFSSIFHVEFASKSDNRLPTKAKLVIGNRALVTREFKPSG